jgi:hypothetical protein
MHHLLIMLLLFYGVFLILCGIVSVIFIGLKAKTALVSGGISGLVSISISWLIANHYQGSMYFGIFLAFALFIVFSWRSAKTLFKIFELIPNSDPELRGKGIAFLIISLMAVISIVVFILQVILL